MAAGQYTFIGDMLNQCGLVNVIEEKESRYPELSEEKIKELNPDYILLSSEPYPFSKIHLNELSNKFPKCKINLVDGEMFSWYGSRLLKSADYFNQLMVSI
jgi:ABC-type Fe3+-hydroxamate transport system substrate-binding protein